jgi:hypothetical protein
MERGVEGQFLDDCLLASACIGIALGYRPTSSVNDSTRRTNPQRKQGNQRRSSLTRRVFTERMVRYPLLVVMIAFAVAGIAIKLQRDNVNSTDLSSIDHTEGAPKI